MPELMPHQERLVRENPAKRLVAWEMRVGKTLPAAKWVDLPEQRGNTFIITMKQNKRDWIDMGTSAKVITKEEFKKADIVNPTAIVVDEAHNFASGLFIKGRSQLAAALYSLLKAYPDCHVLLLTATPVRQDAWSLHTLLCYVGIYYDWKEWRREFFSLKKMPFLRFPAWMPNKDWRTAIRHYLEKHCDIVSLRDIVECLPPAESTLIEIKRPKYRRPIDQVVTWTDEHKWEQVGKEREILALGYKKLLVVAHYTEQIDSLAAALGKEKPVFILDGRTKDADAVKKAAQEAEECYFIVQSSMGMGFDGYMFGAMVFVSMSHSCLAHTQMTGRLRHLKHLQPVTYYYMLGGRWDRRIYETIKLGKDFNPHEYDRGMM